MRPALRTGSLVMSSLCLLMGLIVAIPSTLLVFGGLLLHGRLDWSSIVPFVFGLGLAVMGVVALRWSRSD